MDIENTQAAGLRDFLSTLKAPEKEFDKQIREMNHSIIDRCTVWTTPLYNDGRRYVFKYEAYDKELLMGYAKAKQLAIDMMRSPVLTAPQLQPNGLWFVELTYYGLD